MRRAALHLIALIFILPFFAFVIVAFSEAYFYPQVLPQTWSLRAWERLLASRAQIGGALWNSTALALSVTGLSLIVGLPAGRALGLYDFPGKRAVELIILIPAVVPPLAIAMGLSINFLRAGLGGTFFGVMLAHMVPVLPYVVLSLAGAFTNYDPRLEEQARTLGAGPLKVLRHVTLPALLPALSVAGLFAFLISWGQYVLTLLVGAGRVLTLPMLLFTAIPGGDNANIAALALLFTGPALLALLITSRNLSRTGLAAVRRQ